MCSEVLPTIQHLHFNGCYHSSMNKTCNYVVVSHEVKIINVQCSFEDDEDIIQVWKLRIRDLKAYRCMLKNKILMPGVCWADRDSFCDFFDKERSYT